MSRGEGGRTRAVTQFRIYSHTIHNYSHTIRTPFTHYFRNYSRTIRALFARTIRTLFAPVHISSHRFAPARADSRMFKPGSHQYQTLFALSALFAGIHTIREVFCMRRGPGVGGCELGKSIDSSQFLGSVPMPTQQSVRCAPSLDSTLGGARR